MHIFLHNFHQNVKYIARIESHQAELRIQGDFTYQKSLYIISLQTDYLNLGSNSIFGRNNERENLVKTKCTFCGGANHYAEDFLKDEKG